MAAAAFGPDPRAANIADQLRQLDISSLELWSDLDALSTHTRVDGVEVPEEGIVVTPSGRFTAVLNLYLLLQYGGDSDEGFTTSDSFRAKVAGRLSGNQVVVEQSDVDTSAFYE